MIMSKTFLLLVLLVRTECCTFTVSTATDFSSINSINIGTTCSDCFINLTRCYPFVLLRSSDQWNSKTLVDWHMPDTTSCSSLGKINMTGFGPVTEDLFVSVIPQSCSPDYFPLHVRLSAFLFQNISTEFIELPHSPSRSDLSCSADKENDTSFYELSSTVLLLLHNGFLSTSSTSGSSHVEIEECVNRVSVSSDLGLNHFHAISQDRTSKGITTNSIYRGDSLGNISKLLDAEELSISGKNNFVCLGEKSATSNVKYTSLRLLDILSVDTVSEKIVLIEETTESIISYLYLLLKSDSSSTCYRFPASVSPVTKLTPLHNVPPGSTTFKLNKLYSLHPSSPHVLGVGSVVVYSPCFGCSWYLLPVSHVGLGEKYRVELDKAGRFVIQTTSSLYYGYFGDTVELSKNHFIENFTPADSISIKDQKVILTYFSDKAAQTVSTVDLAEVNQYATEMSKLEKILSGTPQKNVQVTISASMSSTFTRQRVEVYRQATWHPELVFENKLPEKVYLQNREACHIQFTFSLSTPDSSDIDYLIKESHVRWNVWNGTLLKISSTKIVDYRGLKVLYSVHISDIGEAVRAKPGVSLIPVSVVVFPSQSSVVSPFHVLLGCKPYQQVSLNLVDTPDLLLGSTRDLARVLYDKEFYPNFVVEDLVSGTSLPYLGNYSLTILGAGPSAEQISLWGEKDVAKYNKNGGATSIWTWKDSFNQIKWLCRESSPCSNVYPRLSDGLPKYCFKIRFSNSEFTDNKSYCIYEEELTVCVHGLPLSIWQSLASFSVWLVLFFVALFAYFLRKHSWRTLLEEMGIKKEEEDVKEEYEMFLRDQKIRERRASTLRPMLHGHPGGNRGSIVNQIKMMQGTTRGESLVSGNRHSLAPGRASIAANRSFTSHKSVGR
ncbi:hypothetical protein ACHWQZ_G006338 [Mnemiopsis leidyi]